MIQIENEGIPAQGKDQKSIVHHYEKIRAKPDVFDAYVSALAKFFASGPKAVVCIGTDRSTGDSLGPLVGRYISAAASLHHPKIEVFGTLDVPVHAANLASFVSLINRPILAVDACLGSSDNIGNITLSEGAIRPGAGVGKKIPPIGDMRFEATVNVAGFFTYLILQSTSLCVVDNMARVIADLIRAGITNA